VALLTIQLCQYTLSFAFCSAHVYLVILDEGSLFVRAPRFNQPNTELSFVLGLKHIERSRTTSRKRVSLDSATDHKAELRRSANQYHSNNETEVRVLESPEIELSSSFLSYHPLLQPIDDDVLERC
jgi:hypothetical protein